RRIRRQRPGFGFRARFQPLGAPGDRRARVDGRRCGLWTGRDGWRSGVAGAQQPRHAGRRRGTLDVQAGYSGSVGRGYLRPLIRPKTRLTTAKIRKRKKSTCAMLDAPAAMPPKPNNAAISAMTKKTMA